MPRIYPTDWETQLKIFELYGCEYKRKKGSHRILICPVNLGNPVEFSILELAEKVIELTSSKSKIVYNSLPQDDPMQRKPDILLAVDTLKWNPETGLEEGLKHTITYFDELLKSIKD